MKQPNDQFPALASTASEIGLGETVLLRRVQRFVDGQRSVERDSRGLDELALDIVRFQIRRSEPYRRLAARRSTKSSSGRPDFDHWSEAPPVPAQAFKELQLHVAAPRMCFLSSGTTQTKRSAHHHPFPHLYDQVIDRTFPLACLPDGPLATLSLIPSARDAPASSLSYMAQRILDRHALSSFVALGRAGLDLAGASAWLEAQAQRPVLILSTALALLAFLEGSHGSIPLHPRSVVFETGGFKGERTEITRNELVQRASDRFALDPRRFVREYGMSELTSQFYTAVLFGGDPDAFLWPAWVRPVVLDPSTLEPCPDGATGLLAVLDLANFGSVPYLLTEDLAVREGSAFRLCGRATGAELRGCSLTAEELLEGAS